MITDYKGQDIRSFADSLAESNVKGESLEGRMQAVKKVSKEILVELSKEILKETELDLIGWIQEFVATDVTIKSEKKYKRRTNLDPFKDLFETEVYYDFDFWNNYQLPEKSKYLQTIKAELEEAGNGKTLDQQFEEMGRKNNENNKKFRKRMKKKK